jgi:hypothetical protein
MTQYTKLIQNHPELQEQGRSFFELAQSISSEIESSFPSLPPDNFNVTLLDDMARFIEQLRQRHVPNVDPSAASGNSQPSSTHVASHVAKSQAGPAVLQKQLQHQAKAGANKINDPLVTAKPSKPYSQVSFLPMHNRSFFVPHWVAVIINLLPISQCGILLL